MGTGFLMGMDIFHGYGFGTAKPSGFVPVAISNSHTIDYCCKIQMIIRSREPLLQNRILIIQPIQLKLFRLFPNETT
jgi:hypothetical protein